jgi:uncharacterized iron-regulated membrane protein
MSGMYRLALALHRWVGLSLAAFLVVIGATGCVIAFFEPLDRALNPELLHVAPRGAARDPLDLRDALERALPEAHVYYVHFPAAADDSASFYVEGALDAERGEPRELDFDEVFVDPYSGARLGERLWGRFSLAREDLVTQLYYLHYSLVLPEQLGESFMGWVAFAWLLDCVVALGLTLPRRTSLRDLIPRWLRGFRVPTGLGAARFHLDLHRALGLWLWPMLVVFAVSGFALNLPETYGSVIARVAGYSDAELEPELPRALARPAIDWREARQLGRSFLAEAAAREGFTIERETALIYRREKGIYVYRVQSSRDVVSYGETSVAIDATSGALRRIEIPTGAEAGTTFTNWVKALHMAMVFGWPWRVFVSATGLAVVTIVVTGLAIWLRKRRQRRARPGPEPR